MKTQNSKKTFNSDAIVSVNAVDKKELRNLKYKAFKKSFWGNTQEGFYDDYSMHGSHYTKEYLESGKYCNSGIKLIVEGNKAYYKPYVEIVFQAKESTVRVFDTYEEALDFASEISNKCIKNKLTVTNGKSYEISAKYN